MEISHQLDLIGIIAALFGFFLGGEVSGVSFREAAESFWSVFTIVSFILSALLLWGTIYAMVRFGQLAEVEQQQLREAEHAFRHAAGTSAKNQKWNEVKKHIASDNPNDWRLAIIEADIMLDEALNKAGYVGASIGDKLKTVNPQQFRRVQDAWQAHKVRNDIAHRGSDFVLTKKIAGEAINQFERVFEELGTI